MSDASEFKSKFKSINPIHVIHHALFKKCTSLTYHKWSSCHVPSSCGMLAPKKMLDPCQCKSCNIILELQQQGSRVVAMVLQSCSNSFRQNFNLIWSKLKHCNPFQLSKLKQWGCNNNAPKLQHFTNLKHQGCNNWSTTKKLQKWGFIDIFSAIELCHGVATTTTTSSPTYTKNKFIGRKTIKKV